MQLSVQNSSPETADWIQRFGRAGLITKGMLYCLLGTLAVMAAFHLNGQSTENTDRGGMLRLVRDLPAGRLLLAAVALGLLCYCVWRGFQALGNSEGKEKNAKGWAARLRYFFSGLTYAAVAFLAVKLLFSDSGKKDNQQALAQNLLEKPMGQALAFAVAALFLITGIYQFYYAFKGKYRKHAGAGGHKPGGRLLLLAGMIGYCARGAVWLLIGFLFARAALHVRAADAGDSSRAFNLLQQGHNGPWLLSAVGLGLICYGLFNFIRARYDRLEGQAG